MCKIKYYLFLRKNYPQFFFGITRINKFKLTLSSILMHFIESKKKLTTKFNNEWIKSKFEVLTNENDYLVKNLKKAG